MGAVIIGKDSDEAEASRWEEMDILEAIIGALGTILCYDISMRTAFVLAAKFLQ
jgi:hypothetical protein